MSSISLLSVFSRLSLQRTNYAKVLAKSITTNTPLLFKVSPCLLAEPLKKKKRLDPAILRAREERKKKKIEKQIRRLEKHARQFKPINECEIPLSLIDEREARERKVTLNVDEIEGRVRIQKLWAKYKLEQRLNDSQMLDRVLFAQQKALDELRSESEELYQEALQIDPMLIPFKTQGPVETPPIEDYDVPDGDYADTSKKWD